MFSAFADDCRQDRDQFRRFIDECVRSIMFCVEHSSQDAQPVSRFSGFFQRDVALRNEISATLTRVRFLEIRTN